MTTARNKKEDHITYPLMARGRIGQYKIIAPIGLGGMAAVYSARGPGSPERPELVALKAIHPHLATRPEFMDMFTDEAKMATRVRHPNVGRVYGAESIDDIIFMVVELVKGRSLRDVFLRAAETKTEPSMATWCLIASRICRGAHAAHQAVDDKGRHLGLVHRDITPRNVLLSYDGHVKLIDFGVAWARHRITNTETGWTKGKVGFVAPELIRGEKFDHRSDIFSIGVLLYTMTTGCTPFPGTTDVQKLRRTLMNEPKPPREIRPEISESLEGIILRALRKEPKQRFDNAAQMSEVLEKEAARSGESGDAEARIADLVGSLFSKDEEDVLETTLETPIEPQARVETEKTERSDSTVDLDTATWASLTGARGRPSLKLLQRVAFLGGAIALLLIVLGLAVRFHLEGEDAPLPPETLSRQSETQEPSQAVSKNESVIISFDIKPKSARIAVDGRPLKKSVRQIELPKTNQTHTIEISSSGYKTETFSFIADTNRELTVTLTNDPHRHGM